MKQIWSTERSCFSQKLCLVDFWDARVCCFKAFALATSCSSSKVHQMFHKQPTLYSIADNKNQINALSDQHPGQLLCNIPCGTASVGQPCQSKVLGSND